jgi:hypothetical protein
MPDCEGFTCAGVSATDQPCRAAAAVFNVGHGLRCGMSRESLPAELVEQILASFEPHLPVGVYLTLRDDGLDVRSVKSGGGSWSGPRPGVLPWPPMPASTKWRLGIQAVYETVAQGVGFVAFPRPRPSTSDSTPFETRWPAPHCTVEVKVGQDTISACYLDPQGSTMLSMPPIKWNGRATEPGARRTSSDPGRAQQPTMYVGAVPDKVRRRDAADDRRRAARDANRTAVVEEVKSAEPGTDKEQIRAEFRAAFARHPDPTNPTPGSHAEDRLVDQYAAAEHYAAAPGPAASAGLAVEFGKSIWDLARVFRGTHPDLSANDRDE